MGYVALGIIYLFLLVYLGVKMAKNGRWVLFVLGFVIPLLWIVGGVLPPRGKTRIDALYDKRDAAG
jgi:hypothetical protein